MVPHVSCSALSRVLKEAVNGLPEVTNRGAMQEARDTQLLETTPYGKLLLPLQAELKTGGHTEVLLINPFVHLWTAGKNMPRIRKSDPGAARPRADLIRGTVVDSSMLRRSVPWRGPQVS